MGCQGDESVLDAIRPVSSDGLRLVVLGGPDVTIVVSGELDLASAERLRDAAAGINHGPHLVTIDVRDVSFVDVAGLGALSLAAAGLEAAGNRVLVLPSSSVSWLLEKLEVAGCPLTIAGLGSPPAAE